MTSVNVYLCVTGFTCVRNAEAYPVCCAQCIPCGIVSESGYQVRGGCTQKCVATHACRCACIVVPHLSNMDLLHIRS